MDLKGKTRKKKDVFFLKKKKRCYQVVDLNLYRKEKWGLDKEVYLNNKNFTKRKTEKGKMVLAKL